MVSAVLVEDHRIVRQGIAALLEVNRTVKVTGVAGDGLEVLSVLREKRPDVLITDLQLPGLHGFEVIRRTRTEFPGMGIVALTMHDSPEYVHGAFQRGADGYVLKESPVAVLEKATHAVLDGERFLDAALPLTLGDIDAALGGEGDLGLDPYEFLTAREREVMQLTVEGYTIKATAIRLSVSARTVERHRRNLMEKLGFDTQADLVRFAVYRGLLGPPPGQN